MAGKLFAFLAFGLLVAAVSAAPSVRSLKDESGTDTEAPVEPTEAPAQPTDAPAEPTDAPAEPTDAPAEPTDAPAEPTDAPAEPTDAPAEPTDAPAEPTDAPAEPSTEAPVEPTSTETPYTKPTDIPDTIPRTCAERPSKNDYLMIPSPNSCGKFIVCYDRRETEMSCPGVLYFNYWKQLCDWPQNVDCHDE